MSKGASGKSINLLFFVFIGIATFCFSALAQTSQPVRITIHADQVVRTMQGGIGASWHAIENPILGRDANGDPWAGSSWGANPPPEVGLP